jgi:hypothetical protein
MLKKISKSDQPTVPVLGELIAKMNLKPINESSTPPPREGPTQSDHELMQRQAQLIVELRKEVESLKAKREALDELLEPVGQITAEYFAEVKALCQPPCQTPVAGTETSL